jgi:hypothetical protein
MIIIVIMIPFLEVVGYSSEITVKRLSESQIAFRWRNDGEYFEYYSLDKKDDKTAWTEEKRCIEDNTIKLTHITSFRKIVVAFRGTYPGDKNKIQ